MKLIIPSFLIEDLHVVHQKLRDNERIIVSNAESQLLVEMTRSHMKVSLENALVGYTTIRNLQHDEPIQGEFDEFHLSQNNVRLLKNRVQAFFDGGRSLDGPLRLNFNESDYPSEKQIFTDSVKVLPRTMRASVEIERDGKISDAEILDEALKAIALRQTTSYMAIRSDIIQAKKEQEGGE